MIDCEILKNAIESLRTPAKLDDHPLLDAPFVQQFLKQHPSYEGLAAGRRLGLVLADLWRENFQPDEMTPKLKRQWDRFLVLEAGYFYPFRMMQPLPDGQPQIGWALGIPERIAEIIANGHATQAHELLEDRHNQFWAAICREPLSVDKQSAAEVIAPTTVASRQKVAIQKFAEFLNALEEEGEVSQPPSSAPVVIDVELPSMEPAPSMKTERTAPTIGFASRSRVHFRCRTLAQRVGAHRLRCSSRCHAATRTAAECKSRRDRCTAQVAHSGERP